VTRGSSASKPFCWGGTWRHRPGILLLGNNDLLDCWRQRMKRAARKPGVGKHSFQLGESISVAGGRAGEHHHAESSGVGRRHAIVVWHKLEGHGTTAIRERVVNFA